MEAPVRPDRASLAIFLWLRHLEMADSAVQVCLKNGKSGENETKYEEQIKR